MLVLITHCFDCQIERRVEHYCSKSISPLSAVSFTMYFKNEYKPFSSFITYDHIHDKVTSKNRMKL